ncbi:hypothetical protein [Streptomyces vilmorinianum]|uniref:hypothetical protein n=1 Tax=Streptomyces vilmorinianum TaxID=3051092 RepID=UPI0010FB68CF|nr:hypothetical protein [Streptomyces vilmorinianum]
MKIRRMVTALCITAAAGVVPLATATTAQADQVSCANYVASKGYTVGPKVRAACDHRAWRTWAGTVPNPACISGLGTIGVAGGVAQTACLRA